MLSNHLAKPNVIKKIYVRGGSWLDDPTIASKTARVKPNPVAKYDAVGFRLAAKPKGNK